jgi:outer membrane receptor protein involved in Fe transport
LVSWQYWLSLKPPVFDSGLARQISRGVELNLSLDNLTNRDYYETQNYFESRITPDAPIVARIHGTPGYPLTAIAGITMRSAGSRTAQGSLY